MRTNLKKNTFPLKPIALFFFFLLLTILLKFLSNYYLLVYPYNELLPLLTTPSIIYFLLLSINVIKNDILGIITLIIIVIFSLLINTYIFEKVFFLKLTTLLIGCLICFFYWTSELRKNKNRNR